MSVKFDDNYYFSLVQKNDNFSNQEKISQSARNKLQFCYAEIAFDAYRNISESQDEMGTNAFETIKNCGYLLIVEVVSALAKAIFLGIPRVFIDHGDYLKAHLFFVIRNSEEIFGRVMAHFNALYGQYLVQESQFHKTCYELFLTNSEQMREAPSQGRGESKMSVSFSRSRTSKYGVMIDDEAKKASLFDYREKNEEERKKLVQRFMSNDLLSILGAKMMGVSVNIVNLEDSTSNLGQSGNSLDGFVSNYDLDLLKLITFEDLIIPLEYSKLKYALMDDKQFKELTLQSLCENKAFVPEQEDFIKKRVEKIRNEATTQETPIFDFNNFSQTLLIDLFKIQPEDITVHHQKIPSVGFVFFSNAQLSGIKLASLTENQNYSLFHCLSDIEKRERLEFFGPQDVLAAAEAGVLDGELLKVLDFEDFKSFTLSKLLPKIIEQLFSTEFDDEKIQVNKNLFANFDPSDVKLAIEQGKLTTKYQFDLLSIEQRKTIKLSELPQKMIVKWFDISYNDKTKQADKVQFADFDPDDVKLAIEQGKLTTKYQFDLLSIEQRKTIRLSELPQEMIVKWFDTSYNDKTKQADKVQFADFDPDDVAKAIELDKIKTDYQKSLLSESQKADLPLSSIPKEDVKKMDKTVIAKQKPGETKTAFEKGVISVKQIPSEHLKTWDFSTMTPDAVKRLLPPSSVDELREKHSSMESSFVQVGDKVLVNRPYGKHCRYTEDELLKMSKKQQEKNDSLLNLLNDKQQADIAKKLASI
ncbi:MAG TPA: hypothetical protein VIH61_08740 [Waddliaceae bacterium]